MSNAEQTSLAEDADDTTSTPANVNQPTPASFASPLDQSMRRGIGPRPQAPTPSLRSAEPLTLPSPTLDPRVIAALPEYDDSTRGYAGAAETALSAMQEAVKATIAAREASQRNPAWTEAMAVIQVAEHAGKLQDAAARKADSARRNLEMAVSATQDELRKPFAATSHTPLASDICSYCRSLDTSARMQFITNAIAEGDEVTMNALLSRPAYLSGVSKEMLATYTEQWRRRKDPQAARRLALMQGALAKLQAAEGVFLKQVESALGVRGGWATAQRLKAAKTDAERAFVTGAA